MSKKDASKKIDELAKEIAKRASRMRRHDRETTVELIRRFRYGSSSA